MGLLSTAYLACDVTIELDAHGPSGKVKPPGRASNLGRGKHMAVTGKVKFRDGYTCTCVAESLPWVEWDMQRRGLIHTQIDIFQYCYSDAEKSKGTHLEGGCIDVGQYHTN